MSRLAVTLTLAALTAAPAAAHANPVKESVGLAVGAGVAFPAGANLKDFKPAVAWGFYTDIPLLSSFHISPSALVYRLYQENGASAAATDVSLSFKFIIPLNALSLFAGLTAGVTSTDDINFHVGPLAGASLNIVSNLEVFVNANYRFVIDGAPCPTAGEADRRCNLNDIQVIAGPLFRFTY